MMSEYGRGSSRIDRITEGLISSALREVDQRYSPGGEKPMFYHNKDHTLMVMDSATSIATVLIGAGKIKSEKLPLVRYAAAVHDVVHGLSSGINERQSADIAVENMRRAGIYSDDEIAEVEAMILATVMHSGGEHDFQANGDRLLQEVLVDADLSLLGMPRPIFWKAVLNLRREQLGRAELTKTEIEQFAKDEIGFLQSREFYTNAARQLFPHKQTNIEWLKAFTLT